MVVIVIILLFAGTMGSLIYILMKCKTKKGPQACNVLTARITSPEWSTHLQTKEGFDIYSPLGNYWGPPSGNQYTLRPVESQQNQYGSRNLSVQWTNNELGDVATPPGFSLASTQPPNNALAFSTGTNFAFFMRVLSDMRPASKSPTEFIRDYLSGPDKIFPDIVDAQLIVNAIEIPVSGDGAIPPLCSTSAETLPSDPNNPGSTAQPLNVDGDRTWYLIYGYFVDTSDDGDQKDLQAGRAATIYYLQQQLQTSPGADVDATSADQDGQGDGDNDASIVGGQGDGDNDASIVGGQGDGGNDASIVGGQGDGDNDASTVGGQDDVNIFSEAYSLNYGDGRVDYGEEMVLELTFTGPTCP